jgi:acyl carrier protein
MTDVRDEVRNFLLARFLPREDPAGLTDETPLIAGGILDPSGVAELAAFLEGRFGIAVGPHEAGIPHLDSVEAIVRLVTSRWGREATPTTGPEGPPPPVPPPAVWGIWYEGGDDDPPCWSDLCLSEAEARWRLEAGVLPEHRHRYRVGVAGVAPERLAAAEAERDRFQAIIEHALRHAACDGDGAIDWDTVEDVLLSWMDGCERRAEAIGEHVQGRLEEAEADVRRLDWIGQHDARVTKPPMFRGAWSVETPRISGVRFDLRAAIDVAMAFHDRPEEER